MPPARPLAFQRYRDSIEDHLRSVVLEQDFPLYRMMAYHMGWMDDQGEPVPGLTVTERVRSTLCLLSCEALGGRAADALPAATAVELTHSFSQIHEDIQSGAPERDHRPPVWWVWGPAQGINAGDGMHALARLSLLRQTNAGAAPEAVLTAVARLDAASLRLCEGQYLDLAFQERVDVSLEAYLGMAEGKTAALIGCSAELGALAAGADETLAGSMAEFGVKLGLAMQVRADVQALWAARTQEQPLPDDLLNKKKSFPVIYGLRSATAGERRALGDVYFKRMMEPEDFQRLVEVLDRLGAREFSLQKIESLYREALDSLDRVGVPNGWREELAGLAGYLVTAEV